jgi:hypothetical protein
VVIPGRHQHRVADGCGEEPLETAQEWLEREGG